MTSTRGEQSAYHRCGCRLFVSGSPPTQLFALTARDDHRLPCPRTARAACAGPAAWRLQSSRRLLAAGVCGGRRGVCCRSAVTATSRPVTGTGLSLRAKLADFWCAGHRHTHAQARALTLPERRAARGARAAAVPLAAAGLAGASAGRVEGHLVAVPGGLGRPLRRRPGRKQQQEQGEQRERRARGCHRTQTTARRAHRELNALCYWCGSLQEASCSCSDRVTRHETS